MEVKEIKFSKEYRYFDNNYIGEMNQETGSFKYIISSISHYHHKITGGQWGEDCFTIVMHGRRDEKITAINIDMAGNMYKSSGNVEYSGFSGYVSTKLFKMFYDDFMKIIKENHIEKLFGLIDGYIDEFDDDMRRLNENA